MTQITRLTDYFHSLRFGFNPHALVAFILVMLPNILWFILPAENDILRIPSQTPTADTIASVFQALFAAVFILLVKREKSERRRGWIIGFSVFLLIYFIGWGCYYCGIADSSVMLILCLAPCLALGCHSISANNYPALIPLTGFTACHLYFCLVNFVLP